MANTFKSAMVDITTTDLTAIITVPTADEVVRGAATFEVFKAKSVATNTTTELLTQPLVLQESDILKVQANAANQVHIIASFLEVTKGQL